MILSDRDIKKALSQKRIVIKPLPDFEQALSACAIDLRLHNDFEVFAHTSIPYFDLKNMSNVQVTQKITIEKDKPFILQPGEFALASTLEWIELPDDIAGRLEGRSSLGRLGIIVHSTAALVHPGMKGRIVLELSNLSQIPVALYPGLRVCALSFETLTSPAEVPYSKQKNAKYCNQQGVTGSRINKDIS
ncbi:dCTP deaminase [Candidatus Roizmanbacteria bacterium RIFOXYB2_FULL_38_10]|uniref:dCTP deaminase n=1 Tax=Candidatus Roizmanbacteria bacterium RIFOXYD1_FULL_38_12 TaxID=1802093 RepID=A0A1F7L181_9BACT|nr:MAG: dCTP deaminase [Candidatus Roizmanbacteria bacterium RIFOXYA2_FULL_38_14]OGK63856.1 MAG: dCTP deaminase [Candidatus Roizmanbacteria bacterium RIFOXYA1_FULL_37_12]OGK65702.1 MAG: dCTP deaminase [Candidatus Roizmanbacteria bacterium RIFOXYB1_FULL_40_23]OGK67412.1 MAG: dCTP deaminase [Candidatus Roizmanbacteria bacterium RIFOXYB2_FULL_38_10]OGK70107.1 MAG: dCTP deaminase [Candidatus Roizmanbacteria bacterium RIFOXYC1_FULL_38_14]OGK71723.1 MAG: dCTP deaminase [Candidatus Roizmanbacteria ba